VAFSIGRGGRLRRQSASAVTNWFHRLFRELGLEGASSHSGRRTFATELARTAPLEIVQRILGHASLASTECYLEPDDDVARLVHAL
jgi:integrase/recombinase XerD